MLVNFPEHSRMFWKLRLEMGFKGERKKERKQLSITTFRQSKSTPTNESEANEK
jgi:hypothetical protein